jgi:hypothetical protein
VPSMDFDKARDYLGHGHSWTPSDDENLRQIVDFAEAAAEQLLGNYEYGAMRHNNVPQYNVSKESAEYNAREHSQPVYRRRAAGEWEIDPTVRNYEEKPDPLVTARAQKWHESLYNADPNCPKPQVDGRSSGTGCKNCGGWDCF